MNLQDLGALGEFVSSLFMLMTLIYLAVQVSYLKKQAKMQATFNRSQGGRELLLAMANSDYVPQIIQKMRQNKGEEPPNAVSQLAETYSIERDEAYRIVQYYYAWMKSQEAHFGNLSKIEQESTNRLIQGFAGGVPGFDVFWAYSRASFNTDFSDHVDTLIGPRIT